MAINLPKTKNEENESHVKKYKNILIKLLNFKILLNTIDLNSNKKINLQQYSFLPTYLYLLKNQENIKKELLLWKKYLNNILFYNNIISIKIFKFINKEKILKLNSKKWQSLNDKINDILNSDYNNPKEFIKKYNDLIDYINIKKNRIKNSFKFNLILNIFKKYNINFYQEISNKRKITIDERDLEFNVWQLNYLEYLYSIIEFKN